MQMAFLKIEEGRFFTEFENVIVFHIFYHIPLRPNICFHYEISIPYLPNALTLKLSRYGTFQW